MPQYNKSEIGAVAKEYGFVRDTFEKVLRLKEILRFFNEQEAFRDHLILKGGTSGKEQINLNFDVSAIDSLNYSKIKRDLFPVISKKDNFNLEERKTQAKEYISNLMCLTESEREYMERFCAKEYRPELLFDDDGIIEHIEAHPMALWKCKIE